MPRERLFSKFNRHSSCWINDIIFFLCSSLLCQVQEKGMFNLNILSIKFINAMKTKLLGITCVCGIPPFCSYDSRLYFTELEH